MSEIKLLCQKISEIREKIDIAGIKKTGFNDYKGFTYFELSDFLPVIKKLCVEYKVFNKIDFDKDEAILTIVNNENVEDFFVFKSSTAELKMKGNNDVQSIGAMQTYLRRYLYMNAYEITDADSFDGNMGVKEARERANEIYNIGGQAGYTIKEIDGHVKAKFSCTFEKLLDDN